MECTVDSGRVYTRGVGLTPGRAVNTRHVQQVPVDTHLVHGTIARVRAEAPVAATFGQSMFNLDVSSNRYIVICVLVKTKL